MRFGATGVFLKLTPRWQPLERVTADAWMRKWTGERIYNALWRPLLVGKFGEANLDVVNMAWLWARIHARTTRLGTFSRRLPGLRGQARRRAARPRRGHPPQHRR